MSLYKRNDSPIWWVRFTHNGRRIQQSTGTPDPQRAKEYEDKLRASLWDQERLGVRPTYTWNDAVVRYVRETKHKASHVNDLIHLRWLDPHLNNRALTSINRDLIDQITQAKEAEEVANSTVNRVLEVIRAILNKARDDWEWIDRIPKIRMLPEPIKRVRWITQEEADTLLAALPAHLADMARFSLETGLRRANVTGLQWTQVDLTRRMAWIHPDQAKARKAIPVPLSTVAVITLRKQVGKHSKYVFTYQGNPITQVNTKAWRKALQKVGIEDFRWHDLRHTWASWHIQQGTPLHVLQELGGWSTPEMVQKYAHLSGEHLAQWVDRQPVVRAVAEESATFFATGK